MVTRSVLDPPSIATKPSTSRLSNRLVQTWSTLGGLVGSVHASVCCRRSGKPKASVFG